MAGDGIFEDVINRLGVAVLRIELLDDQRTFSHVGTVLPEWFAPCFRSIDEICERSAFLEDFIDRQAEDYWAASNDSADSIESGIWEESSERGASHFFRAEAMKTDSADLLLIRCVDRQHDAEQKWVQHVHDEALQQRRFAKEREKKEILLDCIVHDLNSPLATILMNVQHVNRQLDRPELKNALDRALIQAQRQRKLIHSIANVFASDLSAFESMIPGRENSSDIRPVAVEIVEAHRAIAAEKQILVALSMAQTDDGKAWEVVGDSEHLARILDNLISNAIRHSPVGGKVEVQLSREFDDSIRSEILDNGPGIPPDIAETIFQPFSQGAVGEVGQSGLGLYFCRMVIEQWGGKIGVESRKEGGSRFWFQLPCVQEIETSTGNRGGK